MTIDILEIRDRLNQLPFRDGQRQVFIGRISDAVQLPDIEEEYEPEPAAVLEPPEVMQYLREVEATLKHHDLALVRGDDADSLYAVQKLRSQTDVDLSWM